MALISVLALSPDYVIVSKPAKLLMHRSFLANQDHEFLLQEVRNLFNRKVWPVNRLDRGTSGCVLFAFSPETAASLATLQENGQIDKKYWAVCRGFTAEELAIDHPLKPPVDPYLRVQKTQPKRAITYLKRLSTAEIPVPYGNFPSTRLSLVELTLETGRRHQIRRHLKWISHPIIGDSTYGKGWLNRDMEKYFGVSRLMLHCKSMEFKEPDTGQNVKVTAPLDGDFKAFFLKAGWENFLKLIP